MPGGRGDGFWDNLFGDSERSDGMEPYVVYGDIPMEFHDFYYDTVMQSPIYEDFSAEEKLYMAETFMDHFYYGGYGVTASDQEEWIRLLGIEDSEFDWDEYASLYDSYR